MSILHVRAECPCSCCMPMLHDHAAILCCIPIPMLHVHALWPCLHAARSCWKSMLHIQAACPCFIDMDTGVFHFVFLYFTFFTSFCVVSFSFRFLHSLLFCLEPNHTNKPRYFASKQKSIALQFRLAVIYDIQATSRRHGGTVRDGTFVKNKCIAPMGFMVYF